MCTVLLASALAFGGTGCGDGSSGTGGGGTGGTGGGGSGGTGGSTGTGTGALINGCDEATAEDHVADATTAVTVAGLKYTPACIKIKAGASVKFTSTFSIHPLLGGTVEGGVETPDSTSPISATSTGDEVTFTFAEAGTFPYYCDEHSASGMAGVVFVVAP